jgi:hypothetical protein
LLLCFEVIAIGVGIAGINSLVSEEVTAGAFMAGFIGFAACVPAIIIVATGANSEKAIERKLNAALSKEDRPQS